MSSLEKVSYQGWSNCYRLSNGTMELIITGDVGPRIIRLGFVGEDNEFAEFPEFLGLTGGDEWRIYGGHRLWHAPEDTVRTYFPDNSPVEIVDQGGFVRVRQNVEATTGVQKEIDLYLSPDTAKVRIVHRLINRNLWAIDLTPWALSVMAAGGKAIIPLPPRGSHATHLLPTHTFTFWAYTNMADPRWTWGETSVMLQQDPHNATAQKLGAMVPDGWAAYARNNHLFVKHFTFDPEGKYPDWGCGVETFTNDLFLEVETLGATQHVAPGGQVEHEETWYLYHDVPMPMNDADVNQHIWPKVKAARS